MAIEDEIINISDLDIGTEILQTDKLLIETNSGTKLLDFKDFVIGIDNISFYHLISARGDVTDITDTETVVGHTGGNFELLTTGTALDHKPNYEDLKGGIELTKRNNEGLTQFASVSAAITQNTGDIQSLLATVSRIQNSLETESYADLRPGKTIAVSVKRSYYSNNKLVTNGELYLNGSATLEILEDVQGAAPSTELIKVASKITTDTEATTTKSVNFKVSNILSHTVNNSSLGVPFNRIDIDPTKSNFMSVFDEAPFSITYPSDGTYASSLISFSVYLKIFVATGTDPSSLIPVHITKGKSGAAEGVVREAFGTKKGDNLIFDFNFIDTINPGETVSLRYGVNGAHILPPSYFSGLRHF
tara:strand:- start:4017 stop:5099 length:1083 start_codon:yes stop_codon:yes gene_type:complete